MGFFFFFWVLILFFPVIGNENGDVCSSSVIGLCCRIESKFLFLF